MRRNIGVVEIEGEGADVIFPRVHNKSLS
jgi:hypothetical protein